MRSVQDKERPRFIVVEGPTGVGKTRLATALAEAMDGRVVSEDVGANPFLPLFHRDRHKHGFQAQLFFLLSRYEQQKDLAQQDLFQKTTIAGTLFDRDRIYASLNLAPAEQVLYQQIYELLRPKVVKPDLVVYLQARLDVLQARIKNKGREMDLDLEPTYLAKVCTAYSDFFFHYDEAPLLVIDTTELDLADPEDLASIVGLVERHRGGVQHYILKSSG